ncbi:MAG TPA: hypothetical protein PK264_02230 [Hyphomicrobiaceae bacterium]|nr:hypothetical protein [Hyphomicrobiaceae bacterium]
MSFTSVISIAEIDARGSVRETDVARLRRAWRETDEISADDAEVMVALNSRCPVKDRSWSELFIETMTDYIVGQSEPSGYITLKKSQWLVTRLAGSQQSLGRTEHELLVNVLDKARWAPPSLSAFALGQIAIAVSSGIGAYRPDGRAIAGVITELEIDYLRRVLFAYGCGNPSPVTCAEAAVLIDIGERLGPSATHPAWIDLFVRTVANASLAALGYAVPTREEALNPGTAVRADFRRDGAEIVRRVFQSRAQGGAAAGMADPFISSTYRLQSSEERALARLERQRVEIITQEPMPPADAAWLATRLSGRTELLPGERALIECMSRDCPRLDPALAAIAARGANDAVGSAAAAMH